MSVSEEILKLKQDTNSVAGNPTLDSIRIEFIKELEASEENDNNIHDFLNKIRGYLKDIKIESYDSINSIYGAYAEAKIYVHLKEFFQIQFVPERSSKTPDFKILSNGVFFYGEVKAFLMAGGNLKYKDSMQGAMDAQIDAESDIKNGKRVGFGVSVIQPHLKNISTYDPYSIRMVIENMIDKFNQNYKKGQYSCGKTISFIYINEHSFGLYGYGNHILKIIKEYPDYYINGSLVSGELWCAAYGELGMQIYKSPEFEGSINTDGALSKRGFLHDCDDVKAVCYIIESMDGTVKISSIIRSKEPDVNTIIRQISNVYNDENNCHKKRLLSLKI